MGVAVGNGGGELVGTAYPITEIGNNLLGIDYSGIIKRRALRYGAAQEYYKTPDALDRAALYVGFSVWEQAQIPRFSSDNPWADALPGLSNFEEWQIDGGVEIPTGALAPFWNGLTPDAIPLLYADWEADGYINMWPPISFIKFDRFPIDDYNLTIVFNLATAAGIWDEARTDQWGTASQNFQQILVHAVINDYVPAARDKAFFEDFLTSMPVYGGFKFHGQSWLGYDVDGEDSVSTKQIIWPAGWGGEYKWNDAYEADSDDGHEGQMNPLDYMYMHNLYQLVYGDEIEEDFEETYSCFCGDVTFADIQALESDTDGDIPGVNADLDEVLEFSRPIHSRNVKQLSVLDYCTYNSFADFPTQELTTTYDLKQLFDGYHSIGIALNEFQTEQFTIKSGGELNIESRLVICENKELTVESGGTINLDKGEILIKEGAKLIIEGNVNVEQWTTIVVEDGAEIIIKDGGELANSGKIHLKEGATFIYEENAEFAMRSDFAEIYFDGGDLRIKENAFFTFEKSLTQSGQLRFSKAGSNIIAEANTQFQLKGNGDTDPILIIETDADFKTNANGLNNIILLSGKVEMHEGSRFFSYPNLTINDVLFDGQLANNRLYTYRQTNITNTVFNEVSIIAPLYFHNSGTFNMSLSEMNSTTANRILKIRGMGYAISQSEFNGAAQYMVDARNTTLFSTVTNTTFDGTASTVGLIDNSNSGLKIEGCAFNGLYAGVHKIDGKAIAKCSDFINIKYASIIAENNCLLDISSTGLGGYNEFEKLNASEGYNIDLRNAEDILMNKGYNSFDDQGSLPIINGTLQVPPTPPGLVHVYAPFNKWNAANTEPSASEITVTSSITGAPVNFSTPTPGDDVCPLPTDPIITGTYFNVPGLQDAEGRINTLNFNNVLFSDALNTCLEASKLYNDANTDAGALVLFEEVLTEYPTMAVSQRNDVLARHGLGLMKQTLQHAFKTEEITRAQNTTQFQQDVQRYVNVLNAISSAAFTQTNYQQMFYVEMDKVNLFHSLGKTDLALQLLLNAESCGLDSLEQVHVNHWKKELQTEINQVNYGVDAAYMDTTWVDTTVYNPPTNQLYGGFGSYITDINSVQFFACGNNRALGLGDETATNFVPVSIYPNPNTGVFEVSYDLPQNSTGMVIVYNAEGKEVYRFNCKEGAQRKTVDISQAPAGTYLFTYFINGAAAQSGKVIVQ